MTLNEQQLHATVCSGGKTWSPLDFNTEIEPVSVGARACLQNRGRVLKGGFH